MKRGKLKKPAKPLALVDTQTVKVDCVEVETRKPFSFPVTIREYTRLRVGDVVLHDGIEQVVTQVNPSCARVIPVNSSSTKEVTFTPRFSDKPVTFKAPVKHDPTAISANSECEIVRRLGKNWKEKLTSLRE